LDGAKEELEKLQQQHSSQAAVFDEMQAALLEAQEGLASHQQQLADSRQQVQQLQSQYEDAGQEAERLAYQVGGLSLCAVRLRTC
jgi:chromosome segregation ATPase